MTVQKGKHSDRNYEFCLSEYVALRKEIEWLLTEESTRERNTVIAVGATWAWLFSNPEKITSAPWAWFIPVLFVVLGILRCLGNRKQWSVFHSYIERIEGVFLDSGSPGGWEHFSWGKTQWRSTIAFWTVLFLVVAWVGVRQSFH
jgi:hypothetical protein